MSPAHADVVTDRTTRTPRAPRSAAVVGGLLGAALAAALLAPPAAARGPGGEQDELPEPVSLSAAASELPLQHGRRRSSAGKLEEKLSVPVRVALNDWAEVVAAHDLRVAVPEHSGAVVLASADTADVKRATEVLDEAWEFLDALRPADADPARDEAVLVVLFDEDGVRGEAWAAVLETLVERNELVPDAARALVADPGPLMLRGLPGFLQPTFDMAGDAAAGDDEFRLDNELAHKLAQCVLKARFGEVPESLRWGVGFLVEQRLFRTIYQMNATGFVAAEDHFDWPAKAREAVLEAEDRDAWAPAEFALHDDGAGRATTPQRITWALLDHLYDDEPERLSALLAELAALHEDGAGWLTNAGRYMGDAEATRAALAAALDGVSAKALAKHLKRVK